MKSADYRQLMLELIAYNDSVVASSRQQTEQEQTIEASRLQAIAELKVKPNRKEQYLIFKSAKLRQHIMALKNDFLKTINQSVNDDFVTSVVPLAAASEGENISIESDEFSLNVHFEFDEKKPVLHMTLNSSIKKYIPKGFSIALKDDKGRIWLSGKPTESGELLGEWPFADEEITESLNDSVLYFEII